MPRLTLPRPSTAHPPHPPIPGPSETSFTATFGALLPPAHFLHTSAGKAAYYVFPPSSPSPSAEPPPRVLLLHGVQTPALGLLPLVNALRELVPRAEMAVLDLWGHGLSDTPVLAHEGGLFWGLVGDVLGELGWVDVHVVGFSFGAVVGMGYVTNTAAGEKGKGVGSLVLVAPGGLMRKGWFGEEERGWLGRGCKEEDEERAAEWVVSVLEGGELVVPRDWEERVGRGDVVAEKLREWQMSEHPGHAASVVGIFRDGGVLDNDELFVKAKGTGTPSLVVLGGDDDLSTEKELVDFGFDVKVVPQAGHGVVRDKAAEVAQHIGEFWRGLV